MEKTYIHIKLKLEQS